MEHKPIDINDESLYTKEYLLGKRVRIISDQIRHDNPIGTEFIVTDFHLTSAYIQCPNKLWVGFNSKNDSGCGREIELVI